MKVAAEIAQCMTQLVQNAVKLVKFLLNRLKADRFIAGTVTNQNQDTRI